jgi:branched-chain amino acid transport system substrate-binding protein
VAGRLNHPNVIQTLEAGSDAGRHFLAMEYVDGQPVNRVVRALLRHPGFDLSARLTIVLRTLLGLEYAHQLTDYDGTPLAIVHRDVSPGNILVGYDGQIKLTDFGIAKANDSNSQTRVGFLKGKIGYMAPEQTRSSNVDRRADIYAAGVVLWELIVGRRMWRGAGQAEILTRVAAGDIPAPRQVNPRLSQELEAICMKALSPKREDRYATAADFAAALEGFVQGNLEPRNERDVGRLVAEAFTADRARVREILDQQLSWRSHGSATLPHLASLHDSRTHAAVRAGQEGLTPSYVRIPPTSATATTSPGVLMPTATVRPDARTRRRLALAIGGGVAVLALGGAALTVGPGAAPPVVAPVATPPVRPVVVSTQQGVGPTEITLGMSAVFSGPSRQLGENMKLGLETAFSQVNAEGGVHGRKLRLVALDDGYEASRVTGTMTELLDQRRVFAVIGNVGTPTSAVAAPIASKKRAIFFGAFTGAPVLRQDPPDRYVFNYRASYRDETAASVAYLVREKKIPLEQIVVFAQEDSFGDAGYEGVVKAARQLDPHARDLLRVGYKRNTTDVEAAVAQVLKYHDRTMVARRSNQAGEPVRVARHPVKAIIMVATYHAGAKFIQALRKVPRLGKPLFFNVSFVGTEALAEDLKGLDPSLCQGVYITQVVPPVSSGGTGVRRYREALARFEPQAQPGFVSLEGYIVGSLFAEALKRTGPEVTTERLVDTLEQFEQVDLGFGAPLSFSLSQHQGSRKIWGTRFDETCAPQPVDLD